MSRIFIDTSSVVAFFDKGDAYHQQAMRILGGAFEKKIEMVSTDYALDETVTTIMARAGHKEALKSGEFLLQSNIVTLVWLDQDIKLRAWDYFRKHKDKGYSFTDCTSFVLMKEMRISHYLAFDDHFRQAGFTRFTA